MLKFLWASFTIVSSAVPFICQAQISDNFSDGNFTSNPTWTGSDAKFTVSSEMLRLQAPGTAGTAYLSTASNSINKAIWEFSVRLEFNPSGSNYARVYLTSDQADLAGALNGYFVTVGDSPDEVSLYRQTGTTRIKIIDGADGALATSIVSVRIKVTRDESGQWELFSDVGQTGVYTSDGTVSDLTHPASSFMGVFCIYTETRSDKFYFDDFMATGDPWIDNSVPPSPKDVIITEIFADPAPAVELPESEYIELYNRSTREYVLTNWQIADGSSTGYLTAKTIGPGQYLILTTPSAAAFFSNYGEVMEVEKFPSLNNSDDRLVLRSPDGVTIDSVSYDANWYRSNEKKDGGWSLELIDPENFCGEEDNWTVSEDPRGGTPGIQNSVYANKPDLTGPRLIDIIPLSATALKLIFNEKLHNAPPSSGNLLLTPPVPVSFVSFSDEKLREIHVELSGKLSGGVLYTLVCNNIQDCSGNAIQSDFNSLSFGLPEQAVAGDILLNEILFNPKPLGVDFVEVYNHSSKYINLKNWRISRGGDDSTRNGEYITTEDYLLAPGRYLVFTEDVVTLKGQYTSGLEQNFFQTDLPSLSDDEGTVAISDEAGNLLDQFTYSSDQHSPFIKDDEGVSLERVSVVSPTDDIQNWKSGSSSTGYATPGYVNANSMPSINTGEAVTVTPEIFEPLYGQPDFAQIHYKFDQGGYIANVNIYDSQGRPIKQLANNDLLGTSGFYRWDGDRDDGSKARVGYYLVWFQVFDKTGIVKTFRKRVVVAAQF